MDLRNILVQLVVDLENGAVLCRPQSTSAARGVIKGIQNTSVCTLASSLAWKWREYKDFDFNKDDLVWSVGGKIMPMPDHLKTDDFYAKKTLAQERAKYIYALEVYFQMYLTRVVDFYDQATEAYIISELDQCNPLANYYTYGIQEYARVLDIHPETAYKEFKLRYDTQMLARMRNLAMFQKHLDLMNQCTTKEQLQDALKNANNEIWGKATS